MAYPRDLVGYGPNPPDPRWPGGARLALQIVMNYEEGGERSILHGDAESEAFLQEVVGMAPLAGVRNLQVESMYEYGSRAGFWRLLRLFAERAHPDQRVRGGHGARAQSRGRARRSSRPATRW